MFDFSVLLYWCDLLFSKKDFRKLFGNSHCHKTVGKDLKRINPKGKTFSGFTKLIKATLKPVCFNNVIKTLKHSKYELFSFIEK